MLIQHMLRESPYALIEPISLRSLPEGIPSYPLVPKVLEKEAHLMPHLFDLSALSSKTEANFIEWMENTLETEGTQPIGALLSINENPLNFQAHLIRQLTLTLHDRQECYLRYFDPFVFVHLLWILHPKQLQTLFGPRITKWRFWHAGEWRLVLPPPQEAPGGVYSGTPAIDRTQSEHLFRIEVINQLLEEKPPIQDLAAHHHEAQQLSNHIARAQAYGWTSQKDWLAFARLCTDYHHDFDTHPAIQEIIRNLPERKVSFSDAMALIKPETLQTIAKELSAQNVQHPQG